MKTVTKTQESALLMATAEFLKKYGAVKLVNTEVNKVFSICNCRKHHIGIKVVSLNNDSESVCICYCKECGTEYKTESEISELSMKQ